VDLKSSCGGDDCDVRKGVIVFVIWLVIKIQLAGLKKILFVKAVSFVSVFFTFCWNNTKLLAFIIAS
jgi:hypothetical protein